MEATAAARKAPRRRIRPTLAGAAVAAVLAAAGCGGTIDGQQLENEITSKLESQIGRTPDSVDCPEDLTSEEGASIECEVAVGEQTYAATVTVTGVRGGTADFEIEVDEAPAS